MNDTLLLALIIFVPCSIAVKEGVKKEGNSQQANKYKGLLNMRIGFEMVSELTAKVMGKASPIGSLTNEGETTPW